VTSELYTHDILSQRSTYVSKPKSIPIFSSMFGQPLSFFIYDDIIRSIMLAGLSKFLEKEFKHVLLSRFSSLRGCWTFKSSKLIENLKCFYVHLAPLMDVMKIL
jgi:hypothetical protein